MKTLRTVYFVLFLLSIPISLNMIYNLYARGLGYGMEPVIIACIFYLLIQLASFFVVLLLSKHKILNGVFVILSGIATMLSGFMTFTMVGAPAPQMLGLISMGSMFMGLLLFVALLCVGVIMCVGTCKVSPNGK